MCCSSTAARGARTTPPRFAAPGPVLQTQPGRRDLRALRAHRRDRGNATAGPDGRHLPHGDLELDALAADRLATGLPAGQRQHLRLPARHEEPARTRPSPDLRPRPDRVHAPRSRRGQVPVRRRGRRARAAVPLLAREPEEGLSALRGGRSRELRRRGHRVRELHLRGLARDEVPTIMAAADAMVLTSLQEGSPVAVMEALATGLGVVATPVGDVEQMLAGAPKRPRAAVRARRVRRRRRGGARGRSGRAPARPAEPPLLRHRDHRSAGRRSSRARARGPMSGAGRCPCA